MAGRSSPLRWEFPNAHRNKRKDRPMNDVKASIERLRADLMATNAALTAVLTSMPAEAQQQALKALAQMSVMQEQFAEQQQDPAQAAAMQQVLQATERLYQALQGAAKMRARKTGDA